MKPVIAYIDHSFHKKTMSTYFLREILSENFEVVDLWDDAWQGGKPVTSEEINSGNFEYAIFFQSLPSFSELKKIKVKMIWVPMYDGVVGFGDSFWMELSSLPIKILSFCGKSSEKAQRFGIDCMNAQFFFDPVQFPNTEDYAQKKVFFWQRTNFNFNDVKKIIGDQNISQFTLKLDPDPGYSVVWPTKEDIEKYNIRIVKGFLLKEEYQQIFYDSNIFIAPRNFEGIGMSFIEAMSSGMCVIAIDNPTMNEYITHGENGYLFSKKSIKEIDLTEFERSGRQARIFCEDGYKKWVSDKIKIADFVLMENKNKPRVMRWHQFSWVKPVRFFYVILKKMNISFEPF